MCLCLYRQAKHNANYTSSKFYCNRRLPNIPTPAVLRHINPATQDTRTEQTPLVHILVILLLDMALIQHFLESSPPRSMQTWHDCSDGLHCISHHLQCAVANSREILRKIGSASNKCQCCGWYEDRRQVMWQSWWLCPSLLANSTVPLRKRTILHKYHASFKWHWRVWMLCYVLTMASSYLLLPCPMHLISTSLTHITENLFAGTVLVGDRL
jgi:hypothetical protein